MSFNENQSAAAAAKSVEHQRACSSGQCGMPVSSIWSPGTVMLDFCKKLEIFHNLDT